MKLKALPLLKALPSLKALSFLKSLSLLLGLSILALLLAGCALASANVPPGAQPASPPAASGAAGSPVAQPAGLNVFAAASLSGAFGEIGRLFEADHPGVTVVYNFAGSQQLAQQIIEGAPADVFASANQKQMDAVIQAGGIVSTAQKHFAANRLAVVYPQGNPAGLKDLMDLARPGVKIVLAAQEVPAGQYTLDFLNKAAADPVFGLAYKEKVLQNVVSYDDNVKAVLAKVALGEADAGIVYTSDISGSSTSKVGRLDIPDAYNQIASYPISAVKESRNPVLAQAFIDLVLSPEGQAVLLKYGFSPVN